MRSVIVSAALLSSAWLWSPTSQADDLLSREPIPDNELPPTIYELAIPSHGSRMPGHIYLANGPGPHPTVILLHGFPGNEKNLDLAQALRRNGFNVLFFHYRGAWGAEGTYRLSQLDDDALAVLAFLRERDNADRYRVDPARLSLIGHSMGGFTALAAGRKDDRLACIGAISPVNLGVRKQALTQSGAESLADFATYSDAMFMLAGFDGQSMIDDLSSTPMSEWDTPTFATGLKGKSVLMLVGDGDTATPGDQNLLPAAKAYAAAGVAVERRIIEGDHSFSGNRLGLLRTVTQWALGHCR